MGNVILKHKFLCELASRIEQTKQTQMNPHQTLEFLKMTIRSITIEIAANYKKENEAEIKNLRHEINFWQTSLENAKSDFFRDVALAKLDESICKRNEYLNKKGEFLCNRMQTRWYQEGERSTKYFLNMQRAKGKKLEMSVLRCGEHEINEQDMIDKTVQDFYKKLYEKGDSKINSNPGLIDNFLGHMPMLNETNIKMVNCPITVEELFSTLKTCKDSAPGPDGIPYSIIKLTWRFFGPILLDAWKYSIERGELTHSHENSYLKLLPKEGKDLKLLKNWRPITLSNCDFKVITKTLAHKLTDGVKNIIGENQTAYVKGRQITDNLHLLQYSIEKAVEDNQKMMVVSLDAEKAFDSIEHWYIRRLLIKLGLTDFSRIFDLLYKRQMVSIQLNGHCAGTYTIKNGVKQGDALSCILFILGIEPLLKNIAIDNRIREINIRGINIPKIVSYADDVACIIEPDEVTLQRIFDHYQNLTETSGLKLNADKTELIQWASNNDRFKINYGGNNFELAACTEMKVNGMYISFDYENVNKKNFEKVYRAIESQFLSWSNRYLSLLAKILIFKTFGLSQILFTCTTSSFTKSQDSQINNLIYKFLWNRDMSKSKAPDIIKRNILHNEIKHLGLGMIDFKDVVNSIRILTIFWLLQNKGHPLYMILEKNVTSSVCNIKNINPIRPTIDIAISQINKIWSKMLTTTIGEPDRDLANVILNEYLGNVVCYRFRKQRMVLKHKHDKLIEILSQDVKHPVIDKIESKLKLLIRSIRVPISVTPNVNNVMVFPINGNLIPIHKVTSNIIRKSLKPPITIEPKLITNPDRETLNKLGSLINRMTNIKLKTTLLRSIHGDIYCGTRLKRFGMSESDECVRCKNPETIEHQLFTCAYNKKLWQLSTRLTSIPALSLNDILGHNPLHDKATLTLHAEIISRLLAIERPQIDQIKLLKSVVTKLSIVEKGISKHQINKMLVILNEIT